MLACVDEMVKSASDRRCKSRAHEQSARNGDSDSDWATQQRYVHPVPVRIDTTERVNEIEITSPEQRGRPACDCILDVLLTHTTADKRSLLGRHTSLSIQMIRLATMYAFRGGVGESEQQPNMWEIKKSYARTRMCVCWSGSFTSFARSDSCTFSVRIWCYRNTDTVARQIASEKKTNKEEVSSLSRVCDEKQNHFSVSLTWLDCCCLLNADVRVCVCARQAEQYTCRAVSWW